VPNQVKLEEYGARMQNVRTAISDVTKIFRPD